MRKRAHRIQMTYHRCEAKNVGIRKHPSGTLESPYEPLDVLQDGATRFFCKMVSAHSTSHLVSLPTLALDTLLSILERYSSTFTSLCFLSELVELSSYFCSILFSSIVFQYFQIRLPFWFAAEDPV